MTVSRDMRMPIGMTVRSNMSKKNLIEQKKAMDIYIEKKTENVYLEKETGNGYLIRERNMK